MSQSPYNQIISAGSFTAGTAHSVDIPLYYERVVITNEASSADLYISTDGSAASTSEGDFGAVVVPGAWRMIPNDQPRQPLVSKTAPGSTVQNTGFGGSTDVNLNVLASGYPTLISLLFPTGSTPGNVVLEFV
jgi:hypothetical protein